jgi:hypothetical protein
LTSSGLHHADAGPRPFQKLNTVGGDCVGVTDGVRDGVFDGVADTDLSGVVDGERLVDGVTEDEDE